MISKNRMRIPHKRKMARRRAKKLAQNLILFFKT